MKRIKYTCEVITPMFLNGADGVNPELRGPSFKGGIRFWFRAINGHLSIEELRTQEGRFLGDTNGRSPLIIRTSLNQPLSTSNYPLLPHREGTNKHPSPALAIDPGQQFQVILSCPEQEVNRAKALFEFFSLVGGIGKRSRRGMGSFKIIGLEEGGESQPINSTIDSATILGLIKAISPQSKYTFNGQDIGNQYRGKEPLYPWIRQIQIGKNNEPGFGQLLSRIGGKTSQFKAQNNQSYEASMGHAYKGRFASPIYISVLQKKGMYFPIITTLNTVPNKDNKHVDPYFQQAFKDSIL